VPSANSVTHTPVLAVFLTATRLDSIPAYRAARMQQQPHHPHRRNTMYVHKCTRAPSKGHKHSSSRPVGASNRDTCGRGIQPQLSASAGPVQGCSRVHIAGCPAPATLGTAALPSGVQQPHPQQLQGNTVSPTAYTCPGSQDANQPLLNTQGQHHLAAAAAAAAQGCPSPTPNRQTHAPGLLQLEHRKLSYDVVAAALQRQLLRSAPPLVLQGGNRPKKP
jgi:hypothetical protein